MSVWTVLAMPVVCWCRPWKHVDFRHSTTSLLRGPHGLEGTTLWTSACGKAIGWEWLQVHEGVVALADPMSVVTNVKLVNADGSEITDACRIIVLGEIVHGLKWHREVRRQMFASKISPGASRDSDQIFLTGRSMATLAH